MSSPAKFTTNCLVASTLTSVSFFLPFRSLTGAKQSVIGLAAMPVKKLKGAKFKAPEGPIVETQAIARGRMLAMSSW